jgi:hypothetical protein
MLPLHFTKFGVLDTTSKPVIETYLSWSYLTGKVPITGFEVVSKTPN